MLLPEGKVCELCSLHCSSIHISLPSLPQLQPLVTILPELRLLPFLLPCSRKSQPLLHTASSQCSPVYLFLWCKSAKNFYCQKSHIFRLPHLVNLQPLDIQHRHGTEYILLMRPFQYRAEWLYCSALYGAVIFEGCRGWMFPVLWSYTATSHLAIFW